MNTTATTKAERDAGAPERGVLDGAHPYALQRAQIEALITRCHGAALKHADDHDVAETPEARELASRGLDRMFRSVRVGTAALMRLDRGAGEVKAQGARTDAAERAEASRVRLKRLVAEHDWGDQDPDEILFVIELWAATDRDMDHIQTIDQLCRALGMAVESLDDADEDQAVEAEAVPEPEPAAEPAPTPPPAPRAKTPTLYEVPYDRDAIFRAVANRHDPDSS